MRITGLHIDRFGVWQDLKMDNLPDGITVFYGPNEAGKSTLMQYMRTVLYGFHPDRCVRFVGGKRSGTLIEGRLGGSLFLAGREREYHITRYANESDPLSDPGELRIATQDGQRHGAQRLATLLNGIDESIFNNIFAVGLREIQHLASLDDTQAARQLYSLSTGTDRVSLVDVTRQLHSTRCRLVGCEDRESLLGEYVAAQSRLQGQIEHLGTQSDRWANLVAESDAIEAEIRRIEDTRGSARGKADVAELALRVQPKWDEVRQLTVELEAMGVVPEVPERVVDAIEAIRSESDVHRQKLEDNKQQQERLQSEIESSQPSEALQRYSARIRTMLDQRVMVTSIDDRVRRLKADVEEAEFEIQAEHERLGLTRLSDEVGSLPKFDAITISKLQEPAYSLERSRETLEAAKKEASDYKAEAKRIHREIAKALGRDEDWFEKNGAEDVLSAVEETSGEAAGLRRRAELEKELKKLQAKLEDAEARRSASLRSQLLPWDVVRALGVLFAIGFVLIFCGLFGHSFGWTEQRRGLLLLMGTIASGLAALLKLSLDIPVRDGLRDAERHVDLIKKQIASSTGELEKLDEKLPGRRTGAISLRDTETQLVKLEALMPLENQRRSILKFAAEAERRAVEVAKSMKQTRTHWEDTLRSMGLSTRITPEQLKALSGQGGSLPQLHRVLEQRQQELSHATNEQSDVDNRLRELFADLLIRPVGDRPTEHLQQLTTSLAQDAELQQQVESLRSQERQLRREEQSLVRVLDHLERRYDSQLSAAGAMDEDDLIKLLQQRARWEQLYAQRKEAQAELNKLLGNQRGDKQVEAALQKGSAAELPNRLQRARQELLESDARLKELGYRRGEITEQIRQLSADQTLGQMQLQLGTLQHGIDKGIQKWKVVSTISSLLKTVYKKYEKERQPDTLQEASRHLSAMTGGRYTRIWTPLAEDALIVDDRDGKSFPVEFLSRGTREQLFLSLRLSLISCYSRRKVKMPLVLDDVLVNFDRERTEAAASVLVDYARSGNQVFVFTCHQHIKEIFASLQADVRTLPVRESAQPTVPEVDKVVKTPSKKKRKKRPAVLLGYAPSDSPMFGERVEEHLAEWAETFPLSADGEVGQREVVEHPASPPEFVDDSVADFQLAFWEGQEQPPLWDGPPISHSSIEDELDESSDLDWLPPESDNDDYEQPPVSLEAYTDDPFAFQYDSPPIDLPAHATMPSEPAERQSAEGELAFDEAEDLDHDLWDEVQGLDAVRKDHATPIDNHADPIASHDRMIPVEFEDDDRSLQHAVEYDEEGIIESVESSSEIQEISQVVRVDLPPHDDTPRWPGKVGGLRFASESDAIMPQPSDIEGDLFDSVDFASEEVIESVPQLPIDSAAAASIIESLMPQTLDEVGEDSAIEFESPIREEISSSIDDITMGPQIDDVDIDDIRTIEPELESVFDTEMVSSPGQIGSVDLDPIIEPNSRAHAQSSQLADENSEELQNSLTDNRTLADLQAIAPNGLARDHEILAADDQATSNFDVQQLEPLDKPQQQAIEEPPMNFQTPDNLAFTADGDSVEQTPVVNLNAAEVEQHDQVPAASDEVAEEEYEYVEIDGDEDEEDSEYEYEYVEVDEDDDEVVAEGEEAEGDDVEYEYVEVDEDEEDGEEAEGDEEVVAGSEEEEYEYEYVEVDEDEEDGEVAEGDDVEYEYDEVDDEEDY